MFCPIHNNFPCLSGELGELHALKSLELKFGLSSEFSECLDNVPVGILLNVLFHVFRFSKACFNALTSSFIKFWNFVAILALRLIEGCHGNFVISLVNYKLMLKFHSKIRSNSSPMILSYLPLDAQLKMLCDLTMIFFDMTKEHYIVTWALCYV